MGIPLRFGPYRVVAPLGGGGMGLVFRAQHEETGAEVAIKTVRVPYGSDLAGIRCEIHALTRLSHPGVVRIVTEGVEEGLPWYAMDLVEGRTLEDFVRSLWRIPQVRARGTRATAAGTGDETMDIGSGPMISSTSDVPVPEASPWGETAMVGSTSVPLSSPSPHAVTIGGASGVVSAPIGDASPHAVTVATGSASVSAPLVDAAAVAQFSAAAPVDPRLVVAAAAGRLDEVLALVRRLCAPLAFLHGSGIVHRDLKPANVILRADGAPVLVDFGLVARSQAAGGREVLEVAGHVIGTVAYMAPEQIEGRLVDARCDLYALGVMLYELVTGLPPFLGANPYDVAAQHLGRAPLPPSAIAEGVPPALEDLILRLLAKAPSKRIGHADDVAAAIAEIQGEELAANSTRKLPRPTAYLYRPELAGRRDVLARFIGELDRAKQHGRGHLAFVGGESGVGKTYLAAALAREATVRQMRVVTGECLPLATPDGGPTEVRGAPLHPFRRLLEAISDRCREGGRAETDRLLGPRGKILAAYDPSLAGLPGQDAYPDAGEVPAEAARRRILDALAASLAAFVDTSPVLLILDDLQWADELSLGLLASLDASYLGDLPLVVLGTYRTEEVGDALREVLRLPCVHNVELGRLDEGTVGQLVGDMLAMPDPPPAFVRALATRSAGNPFFVAEYLRAAVADGLLYRERGAWRIAGATEGPDAYASLPAPGSIRELVGRRLDGLSEGARALVEVAAVLGREAEGAVLVAVARMAQADALAAVKELLSRQVIEEPSAGRFRFGHDKLREIAYERVPAVRRRALHGEAAAAIEARYAGTPGFPLLYSELAHHLAEAGDLPRAIDYLEKAGDEAARCFANREAVRFFTEALALAARSPVPVDGPRRAAWERKLGSAYLGLGKLVESQDHLHEAVKLLEHPMPQPAHELALGLARQAARQVRQRFAPPRWEACTPEDRALLLEAARAYDLLMPVSYFVTGDLGRILYATLANLNLAEQAGPSPELALAYANAHVTAGLIPWFWLAEMYGEKAQKALARVTDPAVRTWVHVLSGSYAVGVGAWEIAREHGAACVKVADEVGFHRRAEEGRGILGNVFFLRGAYGEAFSVSEVTFESGLRGDPQTQVWGLAGMAQACSYMGRCDQAIEHAAQTEPLLKEKLGRPEKIMAYGAHALARLRAGEHARARAVAEAGLTAMCEGAPIAFYCINAYSSIAEVFLDLWETGRDVDVSRTARRAVKEVQKSARVFPVHRPRALAFEGRVHLLDGSARAARRAFEKSREAARARRMPYDEALADLLIASVLPGSDPERRALLRRAKAALSALGAGHDAARAEALGG